MATKGHMIVQGFNHATRTATVMVGPAGAQIVADAAKSGRMLEFRLATPRQEQRAGVRKPDESTIYRFPAGPA